MGLWELYWNWLGIPAQMGWALGNLDAHLAAISSCAGSCLLVWRTEKWELRQWSVSKCLLNFINEVSLCFCHTESLLNFCVATSEIMLLLLLLISSFVFAALSSVQWPMLIKSLQNLAAGSGLLTPANNSKIRFSNLCSQLSAQDWHFFSPRSLPSLHMCPRCPW